MAYSCLHRLDRQHGLDRYTYAENWASRWRSRFATSCPRSSNSGFGKAYRRERAWDLFEIYTGLCSGSSGGECLQHFSSDPSSTANETAGITQRRFIYKPSSPWKRRKKKKHAGNPAFVFVHRADKMSCHPFSQQEKVRTDQMKALIGLAVGVVRWDSEHCVSAGEHCLPEERKRCLTSGTFTRVKDRPFTQHCSARENSLIYFKCHPKRKATKVRTVKARCYPEVLSAFIFYLVVISRFSDQESELPFRATTIKYSVCHAPCTQRDVSLHCQQHVKHNQKWI